MIIEYTIRYDLTPESIEEIINYNIENNAFRYADPYGKDLDKLIYTSVCEWYYDQDFEYPFTKEALDKLYEIIKNEYLSRKDG